MWTSKASHWWGADHFLHLNSQKLQSTRTSSHRKCTILQPLIPPPWHWHWLHLPLTGCQFGPGTTFCSAILLCCDFCSSNTGHSNSVRIHYTDALCGNCFVFTSGMCRFIDIYCNSVSLLWSHMQHLEIREGCLRRELSMKIAQLFPWTLEAQAQQHESACSHRHTQSTQLLCKLANPSNIHTLAERCVSCTLGPQLMGVMVFGSGTEITNGCCCAPS